ncbi:hypothetical protein LMG7974_01493 [Campylobacter majalis]|uniref:Tetratricopeptide repeat-like domain-containing protein n=1 Tax=Campylobacter majalis TaxID=2790656 RepID=A0ABM8Q9C3_9BACT|nr:hypothetical protein [Campylobacter majalis]CAD7289374.1 hypothetical protein LMG7974_01493 [Campylobacter majalis]
MAIKDDIKSIKDELNAQEQFLENIIKGERFFKKNKKLIITFFTLIIVGLIGYFANNLIQTDKINKANEAYSKLILDPNNKEALNTLKQKAPSLYAIYKYKISSDNNDTEAIKSLIDEPIDSILKEFFKLSLNEKSELGDDYNTLINGYNLLLQDKINEANVEFSKIPANSALQSIVKNLQHYQGYKK